MHSATMKLYTLKNVSILMGITVLCLIHNNYRTLQRLHSSRTPDEEGAALSASDELLFKVIEEEAKGAKTALSQFVSKPYFEQREKWKGPGTLWLPETAPNVFGDGIEARAFYPWPANRSLPCFEAEYGWKGFKLQNSVLTEGFLFQRPFKCGSTSSIGMVLRFMNKLAKEKNYPREMCKVRFDHGWFTPKWARRFKGRNKLKSFMWSILRDPTPRAVSQYYFFQVSHARNFPSDKNFMGWLKNNYKDDYYARTLLTENDFEGREAYGGKGGEVAVQTILDEYDFIGITERFDESAVVLSMLLNIPLGDILYLSVKQAGGFDFAWNGCMYVVKPYISPTMYEYFDSAEWKERVKYDAALYRAANRSLDMTIEMLGKKKFEDKLKRFRNALKLADEKCAHTVVHRCTEGGVIVPTQRHQCLWDNAACGMNCLDEVAYEIGMQMTGYNATRAKMIRAAKMKKQP